MSDNIKIIADRQDIVAIADNIRALTGITREMTIAEMATAKGSGGSGSEDLNAELNTQEDLIAQIQTAVEGLPEAGNKGFENNTDICDIQIVSDYVISGIGYYGTDGHDIWNSGTESVTLSAICGSVIYVAQDGLYSVTASSGEILGSSWGTGFTYRVPSAPTSVTINIITE